MKKTQNIVKALDPVIRTAMRAAIEAIRAEAAIFVATPKNGYDGAAGDLVTTADNAAQKVYVEAFAKAFPGIGLIGEEDGLNTPCTIPGADIYITIDPLDGTKAFARNESHGVGTMVGVVENGKVVAGYVGDVNTGEIYALGPVGATRTRFGSEAPMKPDAARPLGERIVMLNAAPRRFPTCIRTMRCNVPSTGPGRITCRPSPSR